MARNGLCIRLLRTNSIITVKTKASSLIPKSQLRKNLKSTRRNERLIPNPSFNFKKTLNQPPKTILNPEPEAPPKAHSQFPNPPILSVDEVKPLKDDEVHQRSQAPGPQTLPIVSTVVPFFGLTKNLLRTLAGMPKKELQWRL